MEYDILERLYPKPKQAAHPQPRPSVKPARPRIISRAEAERRVKEIDAQLADLQAGRTTDLEAKFRLYNDWMEYKSDCLKWGDKDEYYRARDVLRRFEDGLTKDVERFEKDFPDVLQERSDDSNTYNDDGYPTDDYEPPVSDVEDYGSTENGYETETYNEDYE